jgi:hypothetical protein
MKVIPKDVLQQLLNRPTIAQLQACKEQILDLLQQTSCAPLLV